MNMELETLVEAAKRAEALRICGVISMERGRVRMTPEAYLEMFPEDRAALEEMKGLDPVPGAYIRLEEYVDGIWIFSLVPMARAAALVNGGSGEAQEEIGGAAESR